MDDGEDEGERGEEIGNHVLVRNIHNTGTCKPQSTDGWPREREREREIMSRVLTRNMHNTGSCKP